MELIPSLESVSFWAELCLLLTVLFYIVRLGSRSKDTFLYIGVIVGEILWITISLFLNSDSGKWYISLATLNVLFAAAKTVYGIWFAYKFGGNTFRKEVYYAVIIGILLYAYGLSTVSDDKYDLYIMVLVAELFWTLIVFLRKMSWFRSSKGSMVPYEDAKNSIAAFRGFAISTLITLLMWLFFLTILLGWVDESIWQYSFHLLLIISYIQSVFVFMNYTRERTSFLAKLVWVVLAIVLAILALIPFELYGSGSTMSVDEKTRALWIFLVIIPIATLFVVVALPKIFRFNILRHLEKVISGVRQVDQSNLDMTIEVDVNDEIGDLSKSFNQMTKSLRTYSRRMEQLVEDRTKQLQNAMNELRSTQTQLIQSEKMASLGELTAGIAHEIQNPLNFVNNFSEINAELSIELDEAASKGDLDEVRALAGDIRSNQERIREHGKRADAIVKSMLQHSRTSSGQKEPADLAALADEYLKLAFHGMRAKEKDFNCIMETEFDTDLPKVNVVPQDIGRVLLNLYNNAFQAVMERKKSGEEGYEPKVRVEIRGVSSQHAALSSQGDSQRGRQQSAAVDPGSSILDPRSITLRVTDNGPGIPDAIRDKIFQPFFTTKPTGQGTGLGLSLSYDIVTKGHGGQLAYEDVEKNGARFVIQLPMNS